MRILALLALPLAAFAAPTAVITGVTQTQAILSIRGYSGVCTIKVSETPPGTYTPLIPDVDSSEYAGASTDTGRGDTITQSDGTRLVTIGHMTGDRAMAVATAYYWQVSGCGGTVAGSFVTPTVGNGTNQQWAAPFDSTKPWNYGYPSVSLTAPTWVVDPLTGVKIMPLNKASDRGWRTGGGANPPNPGFTLFQNWAGGTSWTNPANVLDGSTSTATTNNTNPIDLYGVYSQFHFHRDADGAFQGISFDDLGAVLYGSSTDQAGSNNQIAVCLFTSPLAGCLGTPVIVPLTATSGSPRKDSTSTDPDKPWPNSFPTPFFSGWGLSAPLGPDHVNTQGLAIKCTAGACTLSNPTAQHFFPNTAVAGQRFYVGGSSPTCPNNVCTLASFQNAGQVTFAEAYTSTALTIISATATNPMVLTMSGSVPSYLPFSATDTNDAGTIVITGAAGAGCGGMNGNKLVSGVSGNTITIYLDGSGCTYTGSSAAASLMNPWTAYMWGLRIAKVTGTGTVTVGAGFKYAGSLGIGQANSNTFVCNQNSLTTGDGHTGHLCATPEFTNVTGHNSIYFVSPDGTVRSLYNDIAWSSSSCYTYTASDDRPGGGLGGQFVGQPIPDPGNARTFYLNAANGAGSSSLFKIVYSGDLTEDLNTAYSYAQTGAGVQIGGAPCGFWTATNLTRPSAGLDIPSQIVANWSAVFDATIYPNSGSSWLGPGQGGALTAGYAVYNNFYATGQNGPAWIAMVNLSTGLIDNLINTLDGTGTSSYYNGIRWGGLHGACPSSYCPTALQITNNGVVGNGTPQLLAGPYLAAPIGLLESDGVTYDTNTCLDWPRNSGTGCAHRGSTPALLDCPAGNQFEFLGATGTHCLTFKVPTGGVCNTTPNALEISKFPACPWNASYTAPVPLKAGDMFADWDLASCTAAHTIFIFLCEQFRIISVATISGGLKVVVQSNAMYDYCSFNPTNFPGTSVNNGVATAAQMQHANGFTVAMASSRLSGCYAETYAFSAPSTVLGESSLLTGHAEIVPGSAPGSGLYSILVGTAARVDMPLNGTLNTGLFGYPTTSLTLVGPTFAGQSGGLGSILQSYVDSPGGQPSEADANALNPSSGSGPETNDNSIGAVTLSAVGGGHTDVYTLTPILNGGTLSKTWYKTFPMLGWAGRYLLRDISGPGCNIDSANWTMAYIYTAGECYAGSTANTIVVHVAGAWNPSKCLTGQSFLITPCVVMGSPGAGGIRQQRIYSPDATGQGSRLLSYLLTSPGIHYPFTHMVTSPDSTFGLASAHHAQGWTVMAWVIKLPPWQEDSLNRTKFGGTTVQIPAGPQYAEVQFGYSRYIGANTSPVGNFFCTARGESCNTSGTPFSFESDTRTLTTCTLGCTITLPVVPPNVVYYRVRRSADGSSWTNLDTNAIALF